MLKEALADLAHITTRRNYYVYLNGFSVDGCIKTKCRVKDIQVTEVANNFKFIV